MTGALAIIHRHLWFAYRCRHSWVLLVPRGREELCARIPGAMVEAYSVGKEDGGIADRGMNPCLVFSMGCSLAPESNDSVT